MSNFDPTKPVQTRDGRPARIVCTDALGPYSIVALILSRKGGEDLARYCDNGSFFGRDDDDPLDLINVPPEPRRMEATVYAYVGANGLELSLHRDPSNVGSARVTLVEGVWADQEGER